MRKGCSTRAHHLSQGTIASIRSGSPSRLVFLLCPCDSRSPKLIWLPMSVPPGRAAMHGQIIASPQVDGIICRLWQHLPSAGGPDDAAPPGRINHRFPRVDFRCRQQLARLFGCRPDHVCFTANSTEALNIALMGLLGPGDHAISTVTEHNSVLRPLFRLEDERGVDVSLVGTDKAGRLRLEEFERLLKTNTKLVVVNHASNVCGNQADIARIGAFAHEHGLIFVVDASQTAGTVPIQMDACSIDVLCFTGHKSLMGPQGTGGLCIRDGIEIRPWKVGGTGVHSYDRHQPEDYPTRLEAGTLNSRGIAGLSAALGYIEQTGIDQIAAHEKRLMRQFYEGVRDIEDVQVYGDIAEEPMPKRSAIVALNIRDYDSSAVSGDLASRFGIATRPGARCAPLMHKALGTVEQGVVRFSFGWFNTAEEVDKAIAAVAEIAR